MFEDVKDESLQIIIKNLYSGFLGQIIILLGMGYVFIDQISNDMLILGLSVHIVLMSSRIYLVNRYNHNKNKSIFIKLYSISSALSGIAWASLLIIIQDLPIENHFMVYAILISIASGALFSLGEVFIMYLSYVIPILVMSAIWFYLQDLNKLYAVMFYFSLAILVYFYLAAKKYNKNHLKALNEKEKSNNLLVDLKEKSNTFETLFEESVNGTLIVEDGIFVQCNQKSVEMVGCDFKEEILNLTPADFSPQYQSDGRLSSEKALEMVGLAMKNGYHRFEWLLMKKDKKIFLADVKLSFITLNGKKVIYTSWQDITEERRLQESLNKQVNYDDLTKLPNRTLFHDRLTQGIIKAKRRDSKLALFFLDIDNFKHINDSLGHEAGDKVLKHFAKLLKQQIRSEDTLARLGGDEFTIIMENINNIEDVSTLAQKIIDIMKKPLIIDGGKFYISTSIGISLYPQDDIKEKNLLKYADAAMYKAKDNGRNNFQFYSSEMTDIAVERLYIETSLRNAIINNEFIVYYQPQIDALSSKIIGLEALVRWQHPIMGLVSPAKFISIAESTGLIVDIDRIVRQTAMTQIAYWYEIGLNPGVLALNLSTKQLSKENCVSELKKVMKEIDFKSKWLELEVTEGDVMSDPEKSIIKLKEIHDLDIKIAIDDFGTGYSSLSYLKRLPITKLKIDQSFIRDIPDDEEDKAIAKVVIALSKSLNLEVIAEGVETVEQRDFLVENDCSNIQGYYYSKPLPAQDIENLIKIGKIEIG